MQAQQAAKLKDEAENPFALPPEKMKDQVHMKKVLLNSLPLIVAHEQGIALNSAARVSSSRQVLKSSSPCIVQDVSCRLGAVVKERRSLLRLSQPKEKQIEVAADACMGAASSNSRALHNHYSSTLIPEPRNSKPNHGGWVWLACTRQT